MGRNWLILTVVLLAAMFLLPGTGSAAGDAVPKMTGKELAGLLGTPDLVVLDVRFGGDVAPSRIAGAVHEDPGNVDSWAGKYPRGKKIVLYCD